MQSRTWAAWPALAASCLALAGQPAGEPSDRMPPGSSRELRYRDLMREADEALCSGDPAQAHERYVQAEGLADDEPDADLGQVRADLLAGEFRRASAFALLVAGEHADSSSALALGAFLEERAGQTARALTFLEQARARAPDAVPLLGAYAEVLIDRGRAAEAAAVLDDWIRDYRPHADVWALRGRAALALGDPDGARAWREQAARWRAAAGDRSKSDGSGAFGPSSDPASVRSDRPAEGDWTPPCFEPFPVADGRAANGFVIDSGTRVVTLHAMVAGVVGDVFVRNGLGRVRGARVESSDPTSGLAILRLEAPYEPRWSIDRDRIALPVPGRPAHVIGFGVVDAGEASWPAVSTGFVLRPGGGAWRASADLPDTSAGSPIFDGAGALVGVVMSRSSDEHGAGSPMAPVPALQALLGESSARIAAPGPAIPTRELLERTQGAVVVVVVPHASR